MVFYFKHIYTLPTETIYLKEKKKEFTLTAVGRLTAVGCS
jgi:hypothetical protein